MQCILDRRTLILGNVINLDKEILGILEHIIMCRPAPIRRYDQIYMKAYDMFRQAMLVSKSLSERRVVFLGDGDAMSLLFLLLMEKEYIPCARQLSVLDFDERIINNYKEQFLIHSKKEIYLSTELYNVINPVLDANKGNYEFFYINPPYGSQNDGKSCMAWIYRCMELCTEHCEGCIILPYDQNLQWTVNNLKNIESFLINNGFVIKDVVSGMHQYHLLDNPDLMSSTIIVERIKGIKSAFEDKMLSEDMVRNFYGKARKLPEYIRDNGEIYGLEDYNWKFGKQAY